MDTRTAILELADNLIRQRGFNAFSYADIAKELDIKTASVHYHFPSKTSVGVAVVQEHLRRLEALRNRTVSKTPLKQLEAFFSIYDSAHGDQKICIVGSLASDLNTIVPEIQAELKRLVSAILCWVTEILTAGREDGVFQFSMEPRTKALMIITNMLAAVQLTRVTGAKDFRLIKTTIIHELTGNK